MFLQRAPERGYGLDHRDEPIMLGRATRAQALQTHRLVDLVAQLAKPVGRRRRRVAPLPCIMATGSGAPR
ncbi:hypothetical protein [uncultured Sphingomonas sp.]|uniref:hypothetical protein n=1 Tax=uncultured Sphingomonas sp. TaxID=158754 RepID=UPI0035CA97B7